MAERLDGIVLRELRVRRFGTLRSGRPGTASWSRTTIWGFAALRGGASACGLPGGEWAALLGWSSRAFKVGAWERWLGWLPEQQFRRLHLIAGNTRFLVFAGLPGSEPGIAGSGPVGAAPVVGHGGAAGASGSFDGDLRGPGPARGRATGPRAGRRLGRRGALAGTRATGGSTVVRRRFWRVRCAPARRRR